MKCAIDDCEDAATHSIEISMPFSDPLDKGEGTSAIYSVGFCIYHGLIRARLSEVPPEIKAGIEEVIKQQKYMPIPSGLQLKLVELTEDAKKAVDQDTRLRDSKVN